MKPILWLLSWFGLVRKEDAHDEELPKMAERAARARNSALQVQYELHRSRRKK